jgi:hypothetical protein
MKAVTGAKSKTRMPASVSSPVANDTCASPSPKICPRMAQSFCGLSSSPITKRNMTTPSSAKVQDRIGIGEEPEHGGSDQRPGGEVAEDRAEPEAAEERHCHHRRAHQHNRRADHRTQTFRGHRCSPACAASPTPACRLRAAAQEPLKMLGPVPRRRT